jgi:hypothetical protein
VKSCKTFQNRHASKRRMTTPNYFGQNLSIRWNKDHPRASYLNGTAKGLSNGVAK